MISVSISTNAKQDRRLGILLQLTNIQRVKVGLQEYATFNDYVEDYLRDSIKAWIRSIQETDPEDMKQAYIDADDYKQDQIKAILGIT